MKILYVAMKHDYGVPERGYSFEHHNFYDSLHQMGHDIIYFDFVTLMRQHGRKAMNRRLVDVAKAERADMMFAVLHEDELDPDAVRRVSLDAGTMTINWFCDDHWRFEGFSSRWAPNFDWVVTTSRTAFSKYHTLGYKRVIRSQWACNAFLYRKLDVPVKYDVTFVGQPHGNRRDIVQALRAAGIDVQVWGYGWETGRLTQEGMIRVFNESRVNLNLPNAGAPMHVRTSVQRPRFPRVVAASRRDNTSSGRMLKRLKRHARPLVRRLEAGRIARDPSAHAARHELNLLPEQIKGRNFEVPGCGGFLLTGAAGELSEYYQPGLEVAAATDTQNLIELARHYLDDEAARTVVARAGYERTLREHTYVHRFAEIFSSVGVRNEDAGEGSGETLEVN